MKNILTIVLLTALLPAREIYKQVRVHSDTPKTIFTLQESGLDIDHSHREPGKWIEFSVSASRIYLLDETELSYKIIHEDLERYYASRIDSNYESRDFDLGSMGGYYTFAEIETTSEGNPIPVLYRGVCFLAPKEMFFADNIAKLPGTSTKRADIKYLVRTATHSV